MSGGHSSSIFWYVYDRWFSLSESLLVLFRWDPNSKSETKREYHLVINERVKVVVSELVRSKSCCQQSQVQIQVVAAPQCPWVFLSDLESLYLSPLKRAALLMWFSKQIKSIYDHFSQLDCELRVWFDLFVGCLDTYIVTFGIRSLLTSTPFRGSKSLQGDKEKDSLLHKQSHTASTFIIKCKIWRLRSYYYYYHFVGHCSAFLKQFLIFQTQISIIHFLSNLVIHYSAFTLETEHPFLSQKSFFTHHW